MADFDLAVIGANAAGAAVARDAAGRGVRTLLVAEGDLAFGASPGGCLLMRAALSARWLRPLRGWRAALAERAIMLETAPQLVRPLRLMLPGAESERSELALRLRLLVCDLLAGRRPLPASAPADLTHHPFGAPLRRQYDRGLAFSDVWVDEVRLPIACARDAAERGAAVRAHARCQLAERGEVWTLALKSRGEREAVTARALVNAAGAPLPLPGATPPARPPPAARRIKETWIAAPRLFDHAGAYLLPDRVHGGYALALPFSDDLTLLGPLERPVPGDVLAVSPGAAEIDALCALGNHYFRRGVPADEAFAFARFRPAPRAPAGGRANGDPDSAIQFDRPPNLAPLVTLQEGPAILARRTAERAVDWLTAFFGAEPAWTARASLPGGDFAADGFDALAARIAARWPFLEPHEARRFAASYGARAERILAAAAAREDLGERFGPDLAAAEVRYLMREEWAEAADDILWRRSRLGLGFPPAARVALARFMAAEAQAGPPAAAAASDEDSG